MKLVMGAVAVVDEQNICEPHGVLVSTAYSQSMLFCLPIQVACPPLSSFSPAGCKLTSRPLRIHNLAPSS